MKPIEHIDEIIRDSFGLWITGLFSAVSGWNPSLTFHEHREAFFWLLESLLRTGKVKFVVPGADCYVSPENPNPRLTVDDEEAHWHEPVEVIIAWLRSRWPEQAHDENDLVLTEYFYAIPAILWVGTDGQLYGS